MTSLAPGLLTRLDAAQEVAVVTRRTDGSTRRPVVVWVVRAGEHAYVRSVLGTEGVWYRRVTAAGSGVIEVDGTGTEVRFTPVGDSDRAVQAAVDAAYRAKYAPYAGTDLEPILTEGATATTLRLDPVVG